MGAGAFTLSIEEVSTVKSEEVRCYPRGCWRSEARSSTAVEDAIEARPGRVTVHIWSSVRSVNDWSRKSVSFVQERGKGTYVGRRDDIVAIITPEPFALRERAPRTVPHDEESVEPERSVEYDLALRRAKHCREPATLARVHEQEDYVVLVNKLLERRDVLLRLFH